MCGLSGILERSASTPAIELERAARAMTDVLRHRGPDDGGIWTDAAAGIALGHRRLAVIDLSPEGHQPMFSACGRYVIVFNGEIFNFRALRRELEPLGHRFRGRSDTEVMLAAIRQWGVKAAIVRFVGMFAFALWDRAERTLWLVRDRLGIKPLYYFASGEIVLFGSELKALRAHPRFVPEIDRDAFAAYVRHDYVPAPHTIYRGVRKLLPGTLLAVRPDRVSAEPVAYWSARAVAEAGLGARLDGRPEEAVERLDALLRDAVKLRMEADVPLGAFLSGGIDSSTVVALMQAQSSKPIKTFTIGFHEAGYDEARHARSVAAHLGTEHTELYVEASHARELIPRIPDWYDEPFSDSSQLPSYLISEMTRRSVTVALSGDGGDELFAGYDRYFWAASIWRLTSSVPVALRPRLARLLFRLSPERIDRLAGWLPRPVRPPMVGDRVQKVASTLELASVDALYLRLVSLWREPDMLVRSGQEPKGVLWDTTLAERIPDSIERHQFFDLVTYLPDDILTKVDRASMAVSLEARVPLLDHRVVEFAWRLPMVWKVRDGKGKWILRQVLHRYVPPALVERPKMGFGVPIDAWLRGPLRDWAEGLIGEDRLRREGFFEVEPIRRTWREHLSGRRNWHYLLWTVLMFQAWRERWG